MTLSFTVILICAFSLTHATHHVFLIAGQSNSVGFNVDGFTNEDSPNNGILQLSCCRDGATLPIEQCDLVVSQDPLHHYCDPGYLSQQTVGFGMSFAREYIKEVPSGDVVVLVPAGLSGTGFFDNTWTAYSGYGFTAAVAKLKRTFDIIGQNAKFEGILWHQGEHDAGDNGGGNVADTDFYLNNDIIPLVNALRDQSLLPFSASNVPFVCGNLLPSWGTNPSQPQRAGVWNAITLLDQYIPYSACSPSQGLLGDPVYLSGLNGEIIHFTARSERVLGKRYYVAWQLAKLNGPEQ